MQPRYTIDQAILNKVVDYLGTRPFNEVNDLIAATQRDVAVYEIPEPVIEPPKVVKSKKVNK